MFAVKGWTVDSNLLRPQTEPFKTTNSDAGNHESASQKLSRKRKREQNAVNVGAEDVESMWEKHVERRVAGKVKREKKDGRSQTGQQTRGAHKLAVGSKISSAPGEQALQAKEELPLNGQGTKAPKARSGTSKASQTKDESFAGSTSDLSRSNTSVAPPSTPKQLAVTKLTPMQAAMRQKLVSARFRHLNETLYTAPSAKAQELFDSNPDMFEDYHSGFRQQVAIWPENPVDNFIAKVRERGGVRLPSQKKAFKKKASKPATEIPLGTAIPTLPRTQGLCTIADLGCGDARLAHTLQSSGETQKLNVRVLSYDLHSPSALVTKADISSLPIADGSVDVAIFCLALMGTNWISFVEEAYRVLHWKGELWVAEIRSRFGRVGKEKGVVEHSVGNKRKRAAATKAQDVKNKEQQDGLEQELLQQEVDGADKTSVDTDVNDFVNVLRRRGFLLKDGEKSLDLGNKMFVLMEFSKSATPVKGKGAKEGGGIQAGRKSVGGIEDDVATVDETKALKPCLYKIR